MAKRMFDKEFMQDILYGASEAEIISDTIYDQRRWSTMHELIFKFEDKFYQAYYSKGSTENQDESPWEYEDMVACEEVKPVQKMVTVYEVME